VQAFHSHGHLALPEQFLLAPNPKDRTSESDRRDHRQDLKEALLPEKTKASGEIKDRSPGRSKSQPALWSLHACWRKSSAHVCLCHCIPWAPTAAEQLRSAPYTDLQSLIWNN